MTCGLAAVWLLDLMQSKKLRAWAETSSPPVVGLVSRCFSSLLSAAEETSIPPLSPASTQPSSPTNRTGQVPRCLNPAGAVAKGCLEEIEHQLHPVGVVRDHAVWSRLVLDRHGVVGLVGPLAEIDRVGAPVQEPGAGVEIVVAAPAALNIGMVVGPPGAGPSQRSQSTSSRGGSGSAGSQL